MENIIFGTLEWWQTVVDIEMLQEIIDKFAVSLGCGAILTTVDGVPVTQHSNFTSFCQKVRLFPEGRYRCRQCDAKNGAEVMDLTHPKIYSCHSGLVDMAIPLIVEGRVSGILLMGQVKLQDYSVEEIKELAATRWDFVKDKAMLEEMEKDFMQIPVANKDRIQNGARLLQLVASHVVSLCERRLAERRLLEKGLELMKEQRDREALERTLKLSQIKSLQKQLNPHFMFNTLNTIGRLAMFEEAEQTQELIFKFSEYLRYVLRKQNTADLVALERELECVERYLSIFKARFGERLEYEIEVEDRALSVNVPFMFLQPVVENAILHGLEPKAENGRIRVEGKVEGRTLNLSVSDNGLGCEVSEGELPGEGLGLNNVLERLRLHFGGDCCSLEVKSVPGEGTTVVIHLPVSEELVSS